MKGIVYQSTGLWYSIKLENNQTVNARLKGKLRLDEQKYTNPIAVGDLVEVEKENDDISIKKVLQRKNYILRSSPRHKYKNHIIAANVDQSILVCSMRNRKTPLGFIDRFLVSCEMYHVNPILVFNKKDIYREKDFDAFEERKALYESIGYKVHLVSAKNNEGFEPLTDILKDKTTLVSGQSGVGKSSIMNVINKNWNIVVKEISKHTNKGQHTTTFATMYDLDFGGKIIDTPGIKMVKLTHLEPEEICHYFPEYRTFVGKCKFQNCVHLNEPDCALLDALDNEEISETRFVAYQNIYCEVKETNYWERDS